jgi:hypothetical protein
MDLVTGLADHQRGSPTEPAKIPKYLLSNAFYVVVALALGLFASVGLLDPLLAFIGAGAVVAVALACSSPGVVDLRRAALLRLTLLAIGTAALITADLLAGPLLATASLIAFLPIVLALTAFGMLAGDGRLKAAAMRRTTDEPTAKMWGVTIDYATSAHASTPQGVKTSGPGHVRQFMHAIADRTRAMAASFTSGISGAARARHGVVRLN